MGFCQTKIELKLQGKVKRKAALGRKSDWGGSGVATGGSGGSMNKKTSKLLAAGDPTEE